MKKIIVALVIFLSGCTTTDLFDSAVVASSYSELRINYELARTNVLQVCGKLDPVVCDDIKLNLAVIDNIRMSLEVLHDKNEDELRKIIHVDNVRAYYMSGKASWIKIRSYLEKADMTIEERTMLGEYDRQGLLLSNSLDNLIERAKVSDPEMVQMVQTLIQIAGLTAKSIALL